MSVIHNITFVIDPSLESRFLSWMEDEALGVLAPETGLAGNPRVLKLVEAGGEKPSAEYGLSVAFQAEFKSLDDMKVWSDDRLHRILSDFSKTFGPHAAFFSTTLEKILP